MKTKNDYKFYSNIISKIENVRKKNNKKLDGFAKTRI